jgi:hypothetical protein
MWPLSHQEAVPTLLLVHTFASWRLCVRFFLNASLREAQRLSAREQTSPPVKYAHGGCESSD